MRKIVFNKQQDFISIIAPASSCADAQDKLKEVIEILTLQGFKVLVDDKILAGDELSFFAAPKSERFRMFKEAMENEKVKIIWAFRGGYGCSEFVEDGFNLNKKGDKILIGYSDITVLHLLLNNHYDTATIHGSVLTSLLPPNNQDITPIINVLEGEDSKITGGNLTVLTNLVGTAINLKGIDILLLEDINEKGYAVHRNLVQLKNARIFDNIKAVIFGDFVGGDEYVEQSIKNFCLNHIPNIACYKAAGIGHGEINHPIIMNHEVVIRDNYLSFTSPFILEG